MSHICVLLADDNAPIRDMLLRVLRPHFTIRDSVANGKQLVEAVLRCDPDVIVTDVWMPVLNGLEALRILGELGRRTPCVMMSADTDVEAHCLALGAAAFVCKADMESALIPAVLAAYRATTRGQAHAPVEETPRVDHGVTRRIRSG